MLFEGHRIADEFRQHVRRSRLFGRIFFRREPVGPAEIELLAGIVDSSREYVMEAFPDAEFHVVYWGQGTPKSEAVLEALQEEGLLVHLVGDILEPVPGEPLAYRLHDLDRHPNALANKTIAQNLIDALFPVPGNGGNSNEPDEK